MWVFVSVLSLASLYRVGVLMTGQRDNAEKILKIGLHHLAPLFIQGHPTWPGTTCSVEGSEPGPCPLELISINFPTDLMHSHAMFLSP